MRDAIVNTYHAISEEAKDFLQGLLVENGVLKDRGLGVVLHYE